MFGLIAKLTTVPGKRDRVIHILCESTANLPGCYCYVVARDATHDNVLWVTEVWETEASHDASVLMPSVRHAAAKAKAFVLRYERVAVTHPSMCSGLTAVPVGVLED